MNQEQTSRTFAALADPTRRRIVELLADGRQMRLADLSSEFDATRQTVTRHLDVLNEAGLTTTRHHGRERLTAISEDAFQPIRAWLDHYDRFWGEKLAGLKALIEQEGKP
jgi:DNA-binding transcriptional ArsR family regulator